jgi:hypothetical protein
MRGRMSAGLWHCAYDRLGGKSVGCTRGGEAPRGIREGAIVSRRQGERHAQGTRQKAERQGNYLES